MTFSAQLREQTATTWDAAVGHRFVDELWRGEVDPAALTTYLVQDHQFFDAFVALLGAAVAGADRPGSRVVHARQVGLVAGPENDFFARALDALDVPLTERTAPHLTEPTRGFLALMDEARRSADYASCMTVLLVAEWLYLDWATRPGVDLPEDRICAEWIELHRGLAFEEWVAFLRAEFDRVVAGLDGAGRERVAALFTRAVDLELAFFDAAYA
ncbi:TenA family protein [Pseudonocardia nigra]|uniref:TenA family protein n=1 Tax=Pseudonocardia nigra TaxID=1921578 RepID=UPI001C5F7720|nr:TenA family protein [Pseudonocardia nigra]